MTQQTQPDNSPSLGGQKVVQPLLDVLEQDEAFEARRDIVMALDRLYEQDERVPPAVIRALEDTHQDVRRNAAKVLGKHCESRAIDALIQHYRSDTRQVQKAAQAALRRIGTPEALAAVESS